MPEYVTPLMQQFADIKAEYPDCLILFRLGDFYELFAEDAKLGSELLDITLTRKAQSKGGDIPMAGVPYHALDSYLSKLVQAGHKVAIAEQIGAADGRTLVERRVVRIVTPSTLLSDQSLSRKHNSYVCTFVSSKQQFSFAIADLTTGELITNQYALEQLDQHLRDELSRWRPVECIVSPDQFQNESLLQLIRTAAPQINIFSFPGWEAAGNQAERRLQQHLGVQSLRAFQLHDKPLAQQTASLLLSYLEYTQRDPVQHIKHIQLFSDDESVQLDRATITNLELFATLRDDRTQGSLMHHLDQTHTAMGGRLLRQWLVAPARNRSIIEQRHRAIATCLEHRGWHEELQRHLQTFGDIERITSRLSLGVGNPRELIRLQQSLESVDAIQEHLTHISTPWFDQLRSSFPPTLQAVAQLIERCIVEEPPLDPRQGGFIREGMDSQLDELRHRAHQSKNWILEFEKQEKERTGITSLKIRSNKVFGFYIEVSKSYLDKVPQSYQRQQTLVNAERFITDELKQEERKLILAEEQSQQLEYELFQDVLNRVLAHTVELQRISKCLAQIDVIAAFAAIAREWNYTQPTISDNGDLHIQAGRHPVVETLLPTGSFVPNDSHLDHASHQLLILTGPNMAGKSVYIRQVALISLLALVGSYVPAQSATIPLFDRIFVRSGASDIITAGLSTFMVEMVETASILHHATPHSLIIMDEIGRGTSTYDGISIAWSVAEYLATKSDKQALTLFATHYHELQALADAHSNIENYRMAVEEDTGEPVFLHTVEPGAASHSFGVAVAKLAGVPPAVTTSAAQRLHALESTRSYSSTQTPLSFTQQSSSAAPNHHTLITELNSLDLNTLTPMAALQQIAQWKQLLDKEKHRETS